LGSPALLLRRVKVREARSPRVFALARRREATALGPWMEQVAASDLSELQCFSTGLRRDWEAVMQQVEPLCIRLGPLGGQGDEIRREAANHPID
jgi:hypothetical protein